MMRPGQPRHGVSRWRPWRLSLGRGRLLAWAASLWLAGVALPLAAAPPVFSEVTPPGRLQWPSDTGAHPDFRTEWWYATGWLTTPDGKPLGFQITFFRAATEHDRADPSAFAPTQLIIAHAALSDPATGHLLHDQRSARAGFGLAYARTGNTDVAVDKWHMARQPDGHYEVDVAASGFTLRLRLTPTQAPLRQGDDGYSRKGPLPSQASYYYSEPQLRVSGTVARAGRPSTVTGSAWLDHEWSTTYLSNEAVGWDWLGANLDDGSALMAFEIRRRGGGKLWAYAVLRDAKGRVTQFTPERTHFAPARTWRSPRTDAVYPVAQTLHTGDLAWRIAPLQDDQELDSRQSTGSVYWEGAVTLSRGGQRVGRGYLELTGYLDALKF